ncbi:hypothetical protein Tco_1485535 [Tanacetum coccineum]
MLSRAESELLFWGDDVYPTFLYDDDQDVFNLISAPNPAKVKTGTRPCAAHEVPLLTVIASRVKEMEDTTVASGSLEAPSTIEKSSLDFSNESPSPLITEGAGHKIKSRTNGRVKSHRKRTQRPRRRKCTTQEADSTFVTLATHEAPSGAKSVSDPDPLSYAIPQSHPERDIAQSSEIPTGHMATTEVQDLFSTESPESGKLTSIPFGDGSPRGIYQPGWGVTNNCRLDTPDTCQDVVDHIASPGYFIELRHLSNANFLSQYNINLVRQVSMGSQLRLRFEQEVRFLKKARAKIARRDQRIQVREEEIKKLEQEIKSLKTVDTEVQCLHNQMRNLETLLEARVEMKKAAEAKNAELIKELESLCAQFTDLQVYADVVSVGIAKGMSEGLKHGVEHGKAKLDLEAIEVYDPEADTKYVAALHALNDLKYPLIDQLEKLKDAPIDLIMESLYLENPWSFKEEILLEDAIATNISRAKKKNKCQVVCRTHGVGSAHHAGSDDVPVSVPTVAPQGLAIMLADAATQTEISEDEASPRLLRSKFLPPMYNLNWP